MSKSGSRYENPEGCSQSIRLLKVFIGTALEPRTCSNKLSDPLLLIEPSPDLLPRTAETWPLRSFSSRSGSIAPSCCVMEVPIGARGMAAELSCGLLISSGGPSRSSGLKFSQLCAEEACPVCRLSPARFPLSSPALQLFSHMRPNLSYPEFLGVVENNNFEPF